MKETPSVNHRNSHAPAHTCTCTCMHMCTWKHAYIHTSIPQYIYEQKMWHKIAHEMKEVLYFILMERKNLLRKGGGQKFY